MPLEATTSWTHSLSSHSAYVSCLKKHRGYDKFRDHCHKPLHGRCPGHMAINILNGCHIFMQQSRLALKGDPVTKVLGFPPFDSYLNCSRPVHKAAAKCLPILSKQCQQRPIKVSKILRGNMTSMADILRDFPTLKVIHLLRDPRGIIMSRKKGNGKPHFDLDIVREARLLCTKMLEDIRQRHVLEDRFPGITMEVTYEDLAKNSKEKLEAMYKFAGIPMAESSTQSFHTASDSFSIAMGWEKRISPKERTQIDEQCADLYAITPYHI